MKPSNGQAQGAAPRRPDLAVELIRRAAEATERWDRLGRGQLPVEEIERGELTDHANAAFVQRIINAHGWPGLGLVGKKGTTAAWTIALRADGLPLQAYAAQVMRTAARTGDAFMRQWAHLHDRCLLHAGATQEYGTQYGPGPHGPERLPVSPGDLDARRASVGLPPASVSLETRRLKWLSGTGFTDPTTETPGLVTPSPQRAAA